MRVTVDCYETNELDGPDSLGVYLDSGEEVGRYCIVDDPEGERRLLKRMLDAIAAEAVAKAMADRDAGDRADD